MDQVKRGYYESYGPINSNALKNNLRAVIYSGKIKFCNVSIFQAPRPYIGASTFSVMTFCIKTLGIMGFNIMTCRLKTLGIMTTHSIMTLG